MDLDERPALVVPRGGEGVRGVLVVRRVEEGGAAEEVLAVHRDPNRDNRARARRALLVGLRARVRLTVGLRLRGS